MFVCVSVFEGVCVSVDIIMFCLLSVVLVDMGRDEDEDCVVKG